MFKKTLTLLLTLILAASCLAACSSPNQISEDSSVGAVSGHIAPESSQESSAPESTAEATSEEPEDSWAEVAADPQQSSAVSKTSEDSSRQSSSSSSKSESSASSRQERSGSSSSSGAESSPSSQTSQPSRSSQPAQSSRPSQSSQPSQTSQSSQPSRSSQPSQVSQVSESTSQPSESSQPDTPTENPEIGGAYLYQQLFNLQNTVTLRISMSKSEMDKMQQDYKKYHRIGSKSPIFRKADLILTVAGQTYEIKEVGIRPKGNMSLEAVYDDSGRLNLSHYKLSFNETFDDTDHYGSDAKVWSSKELRKNRKNRRVATLKELDIKWNSCYDETYLREIYASEIARENGILVQQIGLSQLTFNEKNYGIMKIYEPVDEIFLEKNLPSSALGGDLYKVGWTYSPATYVNNQVTYGVEDKETGKKYNYNLKTNKKTSDHSSLKNLLRVMASSPSESQYNTVIDGDYFARFLAVSYFLGDPDDMRNNYNNHYVYFRKDNGKAVFIIYDNDRTLGITYGYNPDGTGMTSQSPYSNRAAGKGDNQQNPLIRYGILNNNGYLRSQYDNALAQVASSSLWDINTFNARYDLVKGHYQYAVTPEVSFANVKKTFRFSLDGVYSSGDNNNMSFTDYVTRIMKTYRSS